MISIKTMCLIEFPCVNDCLSPSLPACDHLFEYRDVILGLLPNTVPNTGMGMHGHSWLSSRSMCMREPMFSLQVGALMHQPMPQHCRNSSSILPLFLLAVEGTKRMSGSPPQPNFPKGSLLHWDTAPISRCNLFHPELYHWNCL